VCGPELTADSAEDADGAEELEKPAEELAFPSLPLRHLRYLRLKNSPAVKYAPSKHKRHAQFLKLRFLLRQPFVPKLVETLFRAAVGEERIHFRA